MKNKNKEVNLLSFFFPPSKFVKIYIICYSKVPSFGFVGSLQCAASVSFLGTYLKILVQ